MKDSGLMNSLAVTSLPVLEDNYIHIIEVPATNDGPSRPAAIVVDPAEADPVLRYLAESKRVLTAILITHHHGDHTGGVNELKRRYPDATVYGYSLDTHRLPELTDKVEDGQTITVSGISFEVWHMPGHTSGHIAYVNRTNHAAFSGDVLFGMGCGRVFEGTYEEMFSSLQKFKQLDPATKIYCTHEYTVTNGQFAAHMMPTNSDIAEQLTRSEEKRSQGQFTVPLMLREELTCNPFLMTESIEDFARLRDARNQWRGVPAL